MKKTLWISGLSLIVGLMLLSDARAAGSAHPKEDPKADCSFSNPRLPWRCNATVPIPPHSTPQHSCETVLRCLQASYCPEAAKYCNNPGVPQTEWRLESASQEVVITADTPRVNCGYSNPSYSGWCYLRVPVLKGMGPEQACQMVVPCMNGGACPGYVHSCGPEIHSGWKLADVKPIQPQPTPRR